MESVSIIGIGIATMDIYCYKNKMYPGGNEYNIAYNAKNKEQRLHLWEFLQMIRLEKY